MALVLALVSTVCNLVLVALAVWKEVKDSRGKRRSRTGGKHFVGSEKK